MKKILLALAVGNALALGNVAGAATVPPPVPSTPVYKLLGTLPGQALPLFQKMQQDNARAEVIQKSVQALWNQLDKLVTSIAGDSKISAGLKAVAAGWRTELDNMKKNMVEYTQRAQQLYDQQTQTMKDIPDSLLKQFQGLPVYLGYISAMATEGLNNLISILSGYTPDMTDTMQNQLSSSSAQLDELIPILIEFDKSFGIHGRPTNDERDQFSVSVYYTLLKALDQLDLPGQAYAQATGVLRQYHNAFADSLLQAADLLPRAEGPFARVYGLYSKTPGQGVQMKLTQLMAGTYWQAQPGFGLGIAADTAIQANVNCGFCEASTNYDAVTAGVSAFAQLHKKGFFTQLLGNWRHYDLGEADNNTISLLDVRLPGASGNVGVFHQDTPAKAWSADALLRVGYDWAATPAITVQPMLSYQWSTLHFKELPHQNRSLIDAQLALKFMPKPRLWIGAQFGLGHVTYSASRAVQEGLLPITNPNASASEQPKLLAKQELRLHGGLTLRWKVNLVSQFDLLMGGEYYSQSKARALYYQLQYQYQF